MSSELIGVSLSIFYLAHVYYAIYLVKFSSQCDDPQVLLLKGELLSLVCFSLSNSPVQAVSRRDVSKGVKPSTLEIFTSCNITPSSFPLVVLSTASSEIAKHSLALEHHNSCPTLLVPQPLPSFPQPQTFARQLF